MLKREIKGHTQLNKKVYIIIKLIPTVSIIKLEQCSGRSVTK